MATDLRERLNALVEDWRLNEFGEFSNITWAFRKCADQLATILAESERDPHASHGPEWCWRSAEDATQAVLPLGHEFKAPSEGHVAEGMCLSPDGCHRIGALGLCGQPRSAHEPTP